MKIQVDWYKETGKWYSGGQVEIGDAMLWQDSFKQAIVDNQKELNDGWQGDFFVVTSNLATDTSYSFHNRLYQPFEFAAIKKSV